jgi:hypothetical protein
MRQDWTVQQPVVQCQRLWPWGIAVVGDPDDHEPVPTEFGESALLATNGSVIFRIQHEIDGNATVEVTLGDPADGLTLIHEGKMSLPAGDLLVSDAGREQQSLAHVPPGRYRLRVWVDEQPEPTQVVIALAAE